MERGFPRDENEMGGSGFAGEDSEGSVERAGVQRPQAATPESVVLQDTAQEGPHVVDRI